MDKAAKIYVNKYYSPDYPNKPFYELVFEDAGGYKIGVDLKDINTDAECTSFVNTLFPHLSYGAYSIVATTVHDKK